MPDPNPTTLIAANDNPGGATSVTLTSLVSVIARAYVAEATRKKASA